MGKLLESHEENENEDGEDEVKGKREMTGTTNKSLKIMEEKWERERKKVKEHGKAKNNN